MSVPGVGPVTALAYAATIDDPSRFAKSRAVGAYLGLTARRFQSGEMDYSRRISKMGDAMVVSRSASLTVAFSVAFSVATGTSS